MAGTQGLPDPTTTTSTSTTTWTSSSPPASRRPAAPIGTLTGRTTSTTRSWSSSSSTHSPSSNHNQSLNNNANATTTTTPRYSATQDFQRFTIANAKRNLSNANGDGSNSSNDGEDDEETNAFKLKRANFMKSNEEEEGGERPNKIFPIKSESDELIRKVRSVLNKVSSVNYNRLRKRWLSLMPNGEDEEDDDGEPRLEPHQIGEVLQLVIAKALDDTIYMHIYAGLVGYVVAKKPQEISSRIRQLICAQMHHQLQKLTTDKELALFHRSTQMVDATRRKKVTIHRFIAELYCEKACSSKFLYERVTDLLIVNNPVDIDENIECLCVLMTFAGQKLEAVKGSWVENIFRKLTERQNETPQTVSKRIQFMILDLVEMKSSGWSKPHNKWWSPSVQRAPERERTQSSPTPSSTPRRSPVPPPPIQQRSAEALVSPYEGENNEPPRELFETVKQPQIINKMSSRSRTRSEGSGQSVERSVSSGGEAMSPLIKTTASCTTNNNTMPLPPLHLEREHGGGHQQQQPKQHHQYQHGQNQNPKYTNKKGRARELTQHQSRALMALLNKVSPLNVDSIAYQLYEVLTEETFDEAVNFIVDKILDDSFYTRTHASLVFRVSLKPNMKNFGLKVGARVMRVLEKNPQSKEGFQLLAELYNLNLVKIPQVRNALEWLMNCPNGMITSAMESLVIFLFISGSKLDADINDEVWMNRLIEFWEKKANLIAHNQGRPLCLLRDVIELRQNKWTPLRQPHWIPPTIDLPTFRFEPESLIRLFQSDRMEFLRFVKGETSSLSRIERFSKEALEYAVRYGNSDRDPEFLKMTGICLRVLIQHRLLRRGRLESFLGTFVNEVVVIERVNSKAWNNWGLIMRQVF